MTSTTKRLLLILELVAAGQMPLDEARRRRTEILQRSRRGRILLRIERAERIVGKQGDRTKSTDKDHLSESEDAPR
jgi:polyhydroxyalkanoate synthesis regulator phasin